MPDGRKLADELFANADPKILTREWRAVRESVKDYREWMKRMPEQQYIDSPLGRYETPEFKAWERGDPFVDTTIH